METDPASETFSNFYNTWRWTKSKIKAVILKYTRFVIGPYTFYRFPVRLQPRHVRDKSTSWRFTGDCSIGTIIYFSPILSIQHSLVSVPNSQTFCTDRQDHFKSKGKAGPPKHKVSNTMEDQLGYVLRRCVRETELPPTQPGLALKARAGVRKGVRGCWMPYYWFACLSR
jgi:hypothetical protein